MIEGLAGFKSDLRKELVEGLALVRNEIAESKAEMIKWMFLFWIGQMVVTFGFILLFLKK